MVWGTKTSECHSHLQSMVQGKAEGPMKMEPKEGVVADAVEGVAAVSVQQTKIVAQQ